MEINKIVINKVEGKGQVKAYASFVLNECFAVHDIRIIDGNKGLFVAMPSKKKCDEFKDVCHPITQELRNMISESILTKYRDLDS